MTYTAEWLREMATTLDSNGCQKLAEQHRAFADALEENARLRERVALDDAEREYRRQSLANEIRETLKVRGHFAAERPSDLIGCVARAIESERDRAERAEAELAKLKDEQARAAKIFADAMMQWSVEKTELQAELAKLRKSVQEFWEEK